MRAEGEKLIGLRTSITESSAQGGGCVVLVDVVAPRPCSRVEVHTTIYIYIHIHMYNYSACVYI